MAAGRSLVSGSNSRTLILAAGLALCAGLAGQDSVLRQAAELDSQGKCAEAEPYYRKALAQAPNSAAVLNNAGNHYLLCGKPDQARAHFERLLKISPGHPNANLQLTLLRAETLYAAGRRAEALAALDPLQREVEPDTHAALGATYMRMGLFDRAEAVFNNLLTLDPQNVTLLVNLGRAAAQAQHFDRAQRALETAVKLQPANVEAQFELGRAYASAGDSARAVYVLAQARERAPKHPAILLALARAAEDAGYYGDSARAFDEYLAIQPADEIARRDRGRIYALTGSRLAEGLREMTAYVGRRPRDPIGHFYLAQFTWQSEPAKSLEQLAQALRLDPNFAPAHFARAWLLHRQGQLAAALTHLQAAARLLPSNARVLDQLGLTHLALDQPAEAVKALKLAEGIAPADRDIVMHVGRALMALGKEDEASQYFARFEKLPPSERRNPRREAGMIELATQPVQTRLQIERLQRDARDNPDDAKLQLSLASLLLAEGRLEEATAAFRELLARNADSTIWEAAGTALVRAEQFGLAREFLARVSQQPAARIELALALYFRGEVEQALKVLDAPADGDGLLLRAVLLDAVGRSAESREASEAGQRQPVSRPQVALLAALFLVHHGQQAQALTLLDRTIAQHPANADLPLLKGALLSVSGDHAAAANLLKLIETRWPEWHRTYLVHGLVLEQQGRKTEALQKLRTATLLGSRELVTRCASARLSGAASPHPNCKCLANLRDFLLPAACQ